MDTKCFFLIVIITRGHNSFAGKNRSSAKVGKTMYGYLNFLFEFQPGRYVQFSNGDIAIRTKNLSGAEFTLKCRVKNTSISYDLGAFVRSAMLDVPTFNQSAMAQFKQAGYTVTVGTSGGDYPPFIQTWGIAPSASTILNFKMFRIEPFIKINFSFTTFNFNAKISVRDNVSNEYQHYNIGMRPNKFMLVPAIGVRTALKVIPLISLTAGFQIGYATGKHQLESSFRKQQGNYEYQNFSVSAPQTHLVDSFGFLIRPFNQINKREYEKWDDLKMRRFEKYL